MREVVLDTETTGGSHKKGDRIIELGMVEQIDMVPTGRCWHGYFDPRRPVHWAARRVHGFDEDMLKGQPLFEERAAEVSEFIGDAKILAHNSAFDQRFLRAELARAGQPLPDRNRWCDTIRIAEQALPGGPRKLDALVDHLGIETPDRTLHGALLDAVILAGVVARLRGAPEVDIATLMQNAAPRPEGGAEVAFGPPVRGDSGRNGPAGHPHDAEILRMRDAVEAARDRATSFQSFLREVEAGGVRVRPNVSSHSGDFSGIRFRGEGIYMLTRDFNLRRNAFTRGRLAYHPARDAEAARAFAEAYKRDFGLCESDAAVHGRWSGAPERLHVSTRDPVAATHAGEARETLPEGGVDPRLRSVIDAVNAERPTLDRRFYAEVRCGRDNWSGVSGDALVALARDHASSEGSLEACMYLDDISRNSALRWVCRGLSPDHALCKTVSERVAFGPGIPGRVIDQAKRVANQPVSDEAKPAP